MGTCCEEKGVLVSVYVEKPKRRTFSSHHHHHHHHNNHHHIHHTIKREVVHYRRGADGRGYISRRAELLQYSQHLRQSARSAPAASTALNPRPNHTNSQQSHAQIVAVRRKPNKISKATICFGNWKIPDMFGFFTSSQAKKDRKTRTKRTGSTTSNKIKAVIKSLKVQKQRGVFSKMFSSTKRK
ncbi:hypothetical protein L3X38_027347 [Prunus dulcis]|uniref:Uncharacterized protein n=1 Tax=Prunus dulcis TaxID=3755 RepID=A0AAD4Z067_PRUDU|nr:hypothetical protein L3X38_027347 [Prunus dulcis]